MLVKKLGLALLLSLATALAWAQASPVGAWKTIDDKTGKPRALVRITEAEGVLTGRIERLFREPDEEQNPMCDHCTDDKKGKPITGMQILSGLKQDGDARHYSGGRILDPGNGKTYRCKVEMSEDGKSLHVRGYVGIPALGRTQTWVREGS